MPWGHIGSVILYQAVCKLYASYTKQGWHTVGLWEYL